MRRVQIFSGSSHPLLTEAICERLGTQPAKCDLNKFSNGETSVSIGTSIRDQDVFIVQSGSKKINDSIIELLIMISACKGGSARSITAVLPYFPYSRQSKKKSHRGAITARMLANLLTVAGITHVITVDLHAPPIQGFFGKPVDNLHAEPLIARWIRNHVDDWKEAVVVSKNPGGSKRVTSLADTLKLNFGIITTDRRRSPQMNGSTILGASGLFGNGIGSGHDVEPDTISLTEQSEDVRSFSRSSPRLWTQTNSTTHTSPQLYRHLNGHPGASPLANSTRVDSESPPTSRVRLHRSLTAPSRSSPELEDSADEYTDERAREVITGRLIQGHIVDDDAPSPIFSTMSGSVATLPGDQIGPPHLDERDPMSSSFMSGVSRVSSFPADHALGGTFDAAQSDEEEQELKNPDLEHTVTLVGNVNDKTVFIIDDMIDGSGSWVAAAETVVKRGGAKKVYCIATHGLFGGDSLEDLEDCECIDHILVANTFPIESDRIKASKKLIILDLSGLLAEAIRRTHYGESISQLYQHYQD
ncbi:hypothetical protein MMC11_004512 [Xylographa trunciseda]|nr:hypothetical protein [Xylographa trunciseda]